MKKYYEWKGRSGNSTQISTPNLYLNNHMKCMYLQNAFNNFICLGESLIWVNQAKGGGNRQNLAAVYKVLSRRLTTNEYRPRIFPLYFWWRDKSLPPLISHEITKIPKISLTSENRSRFAGPGAPTRGEVLLPCARDEFPTWLARAHVMVAASREKAHRRSPSNRRPLELFIMQTALACPLVINNRTNEKITSSSSCCVSSTYAGSNECVAQWFCNMIGSCL